MKCAAEDFRIFWDNAYTVHHLYDDAAQQDQLLDIAKACVAHVRSTLRSFIGAIYLIGCAAR